MLWATYPLGAIGGHGTVAYDTAEFKVTQLDANAPGAKGGLKVGDLIIAANGVKFPKANSDPNTGGDGPQRVLGDQIEISESRSEGEAGLVLTVLRDGSETKITIDIPRQPPLSKTWPYDCAKSEAYLDGICRFLAATQRDGYWWTGYSAGADYTTMAWAGLTLLGSGDSKYDENVKQIVERIRRNGINVTDWNWAHFYSGIFLCEYYLATQDESVLPLIQERVDRLVENQDKQTGRFGHGGLPVTYNGGGLNIVTSGVMWFWAMARECGAKVPDEAWNRSLKWLKDCTGGGGGVGYAWASDDHQGHGRTGQTILAAYVANIEPDYRKRWASWLKNNPKSVRENHAFTVPAMAPAFASLAATDPDGFRAYMDEWRWYFTLCRQPDFSADYAPGKENNGGDSYLNTRIISNACLGYILCSSRRYLYVYGGYPRIAGVRFGELSPKLRSIYTMIRDKKIRAALIDAAPIIGGSGTDADKAKLLYEFVVGPARTRFSEILAEFDRGELYEGNLELRNFFGLYGDLPEFRPQTDQLNTVFNDPTNKQRVEAGRVYHARLKYIERAPGVKTKVFNEFLEQFAGIEPYIDWIKARKDGRTPEDSVTRLASLAAPEGDGAKDVARLNRSEANSEAVKALAEALRPQVAPLHLPDNSAKLSRDDVRSALALRQLESADRFRTQGKDYDAYVAYTAIVKNYDNTPAAQIAQQWIDGYESNRQTMKNFEAIREVDRKVEREKDAKRLYDLAASLKQTGHPDIARRQFEMIIKLYPDTEAGKQAQLEIPGP
ncbi:MAG: hypothetical protein GC162_00370 [Planctomycetes bacterium]|nr:hypothetical protein [Planctomycetota bacterium]